MPTIRREEVLTTKSSSRFRAAETVAPRYQPAGDVIGLPAGAMVITNSERKDSFCPRRWWYSRGLGLAQPASSAMRFGSAFDDVMGMILNGFRFEAVLDLDSGYIAVDLISSNEDLS